MSTGHPPQAPSSSPDALQEVFDWWATPAPGAIPKELSRLREEIKRIRRSKSRRANVLRAASTLLQEKLTGPTSIPPTTLAPPFHRLLWGFAIADEIAGHSKAAENRSCRRLLVFVVLLGFAFWLARFGTELWPALPDWNGLSLIAASSTTIAILAFLASLFERDRFKRLRRRFLIARTMAETLRVDLFQKVAGTGLDTLDLFRRHHQLSGEAPFTSLVLDAAAACSAAPVASPQPNGVPLARKLWLEDQLRYFGDPSQVPPSPDSAVGKELARQRTAEFRLRGSISAAVVFLFLSLVLKGLTHLEVLPAQTKTIFLIISIVSDLGVGVFGLLSGYYHQVAALHAVTAQKYHRACLYLVDILQRLDQSPEPAAQIPILRQAAREAVAENADWGVHQREHTPRAAFR